MNVNSDMEVRATIANHEAGHAVVVWVLGFRTTKLWINGTLGGQRDNFPARPIDPEMMSKSDWNWVKLKTMILLGGEMAERLIDSQATEFASISDRAEIAELLGNVFGDLIPDGATFLANLEYEVLAILEVNLSKVSGLANALMAKEKLSEFEVAEIMSHPFGRSHR